MVTQWNKEFDVVCGADITSRFSAPMADSGVHDWLHGQAEVLKASETEMITLPVRRPLETAREVWRTGSSVIETIASKQA
jgi:hypothetical protein